MDPQNNIIHQTSRKVEKLRTTVAVATILMRQNTVGKNDLVLIFLKLKDFNNACLRLSNAHTPKEIVFERKKIQ